MKNLIKVDRQLIYLRVGNSLLCFVVCLLVDMVIRGVINI